MNDDKLDCLVSLLNEPLLNEIIEERVISGLCCNLVGCHRPEMTEEEIIERKAKAVKVKGKSVRDLSAKLKAYKRE